MTKPIIAALAVLSYCQPALSQDVPIPTERPKTETQAPSPAPETKPEAEKKEVTNFPPPAKEDPKEFAQCLAALSAEGAIFKTTDKIDDSNGCGIDKPIIVSEILPGIKVTPAATIRCETALELSRWTKETVLPAAKTALGGDKLVALQNASDYVCRRRNNAETGKLSEHARGNAIDIGGFLFASGKNIAIEARETDSTLVGAFQRAVRGTACLYFTTVLGPGSDDAHKTHFHLDTLQRSRGYRYCR